ncbi:hypothetical protein FRC02_005712 [Tulasnella sp. 418]|nr:hypothetical protein FRC02_005712 [Tulasnella sp. 418]
MVFPHLCTIELYYLPAPTTYFLLQSIESPRCRRADVRIRSYVGSEVDPSMTLASFPLGTVVPELLASPTTLQLSHVENGGWTSIWSKQHGDQPHDDTSIFIDSLFNTGPSRLASSVMDLVDLSRVVELDLRGPTIVQLLHSLLPRLETLERLVVRDGGNMDNLISALGMPTPQLGWLCPQLRRIALHADSTYSQDCLLQFARARYRRDNVADTYCPTPLDALNVEFWDMGNRRSLLDQKSVEEITDILGQDCFANHNTNQD